MTIDFKSVSNILKTCGFPTDVLVLDFETWFDKNVTPTKMLTVDYVTHPLFHVHCLGTYEKEGEACSVDVDEAIRRLQARYGQNLERATVVAHNAHFDCSILAYIYGCRPFYVLDTIALDRHCYPVNDHRLGYACSNLGIPYNKGDMKRMKGIDMPEGDLLQSLIDDNLNDVRSTWELFHKLLPRITNPSVELPVINHTIQIGLRPLLAFNREKAIALIDSLELELAKIVVATGHTQTELNSDLFEDIFLEALGDEAPVYRQGKVKQLLAVSKKDPESLAYWQHPNPKVQALMRARAAVKSFPLHIKRIKKFLVMSNALAGRLIVPLHYYGAHTGRFSGADGINYQNLVKRSAIIEAAQLRECIITPDGFSLLVGDYSQIEARVVAWLGNEYELLEDFATGADPYSKLASKVAKQPIRKARKDDPKDQAKFFTMWRQLGKCAVLGAGFGMGAAKFYGVLKADPQVDQAMLTEDLAKSLISQYRKDHKGITGLWKATQYAIEDAIDTPNVVFAWSQGRLRTMYDLAQDTLWIELPSGRRLFYATPRITEGQRRQIELDGKPTWGGAIVENVVQAIARDILVARLIPLEMVNLPVAYHVHDSIGIMVEDARIEESKKAMLEIMLRPLAWTKGLPVGVDDGLVVTKTFN